jgi:hypothetical protein
MHRAQLSPIPDQGPAVSPPTTAKMMQMERIDRTTASAGGPYDTQRYAPYDQVLQDDVDANADKTVFVLPRCCACGLRDRNKKLKIINFCVCVLIDTISQNDNTVFTMSIYND